MANLVYVCVCVCAPKEHDLIEWKCTSNKALKPSSLAFAYNRFTQVNTLYHRANTSVSQGYDESGRKKPNVRCVHFLLLFRYFCFAPLLSKFEIQTEMFVASTVHENERKLWRKHLQIRMMRSKKPSTMLSLSEFCLCQKKIVYLNLNIMRLVHTK